MGAQKALKNAEFIFLALLTIGLMGILFLIIFGNLSGNLGFDRDTATYTNETPAYINQTTYTFTGQARAGFVSASVIIVWNGTDSGKGYFNLTIPATNYTVSATAGTIINATDMEYENVSITYTVTYKAISERNTESVIGNLTSGATQFFEFASVWFILTAITILIGIVLGVITLVRKASGGGFVGGKGKGRSEFTS